MILTEARIDPQAVVDDREFQDWSAEMGILKKSHPIDFPRLEEGMVLTPTEQDVFDILVAKENIGYIVGHDRLFPGDVGDKIFYCETYPATILNRIKSKLENSKSIRSFTTLGYSVGIEGYKIAGGNESILMYRFRQDMGCPVHKSELAYCLYGLDGPAEYNGVKTHIKRLRTGLVGSRLAIMGYPVTAKNHYLLTELNDTESN